MQQVYRVPKIEEFIEGFAYEAYSEGVEESIESHCGWYRYTYELGFCWRDLEQIQQGLHQNKIRVLV